MSFWYLPAKEPQKHALIGTREWSSCNFKIAFKEAIAREVEDYWYFFMMIEEINKSQIKNISDNSGNWEFTPQLCLLRFAKKELEKKGKKVPQSVAEKFFCNELSQLDKDGHYSGFIHIQESPQMKCIADETNEIGGTVIPPDLIEAFRKSFITLELTEAREIDDKIMDSISTKGSFGGYKKAETEADKLNARLAFIYEQYNLAFKDLEIKCLHDVLTLMMSEKPNTNTESAELWNLIIQVIGK